MSDASKPKDPLVERLSAEEGQDRVHYALGTLLDAQDFQDEQLYHRGRLARALAYLFGAGTAVGLKVGFRAGVGGGGAPDPDADELVVQPGLAIDPFGRLVEVPRRACVRLKRWVDHERAPERIGRLVQAIDDGKAVTWLFVRFVACERGKTPVLAQGPFDATNAVAPARVRDGYELKLFLDKASDLPAFARDRRTPPPGDAGSAERLAAVQDAILDGFGRPADLEDDPGWILLARVAIPLLADHTYAGAEPTLDNRVRPFAYPAWALAWNGRLALPKP